MQYKFITFEGADGTGKTTQIQKTAQFLREKGYDVVTTREPGGTKLAESIRAILLNKKENIPLKAELLLFLAARVEHMETIIKPALSAGKIVLCDRFMDSTFIYQGYVGGLPLHDIDMLNTFATDHIVPDLTILLDADPAKLLSRRNARDIHDKFEDKSLAFQQGIRQGFLEEAAFYPKRIQIVNAARPIDVVQQDIQHILLS